MQTEDDKKMCFHQRFIYFRKYFFFLTFKVMKESLIKEFPETAIRFTHDTLESSIRLHGILRDSKELHGTPRDSKGLHGTPRDSKGLESAFSPLTRNVFILCALYANGSYQK